MHNKSSRHNRTAHRYTVSSLALEPLKERFFDVSSFGLSKSLYSRPALFKRSDNFGFVFTNLLDRRIYESKFRTNVSFGFFLQFCISLITFTFPSTPETFLLFVTVAMLLRHQSAVSCSSRNL